jgi:hypothetical protein
MAKQNRTNKLHSLKQFLVETYSWYKKKASLGCEGATKKFV